MSQHSIHQSAQDRRAVGVGLKLDEQQRGNAGPLAEQGGQVERLARLFDSPSHACPPLRAVFPKEQPQHTSRKNLPATGNTDTVLQRMGQILDRIPLTAPSHGRGAGAARELTGQALRRLVRRIETGKRPFWLLPAVRDAYDAQGTHLHLFPELFLQLRGRSMMHVPGLTVALVPGGVLLVPGGVPHRECVGERRRNGPATIDNPVIS